MIVIFGAIRQEIQGLIRRMNITDKLVHSSFEIYEGTIGGKESVIVRTGIGEEKAALAAEYTLSHYPINLMISTGVCGGLNDKSKIGDFILYSAIKSDDETANILNSDVNLLSTFEIKLTKVGQSHVAGIGLTVKKVCTLPDFKRELGRRFNADAIDMESYALARIARNNNIPFIIIRPILDTVCEDLTVLERVTTKYRVIPFHVFTYIFSHPGCIGQLIDYDKRMNSLGENLGKIISDFVRAN
jgi:adenosylhomocysteine nucleosidase